MSKKLLLLLLFFTAIANAQIVNIPDVNFKTALLSLGIDSNNDGNIQVSEAEAVTDLTISGLSISDLTGIESFINVTILYFPYNHVSSLNMSTLTHLERINCDGNQFTSLDFTSCPNIAFIDTKANELTNLYVAGLASLYRISLEHNPQHSLNLMGFTALYEIIVPFNQCVAI